MLFWEYMYDISHQPTKAKMSCSNCFATNPYKVLYRDKDYNCKDCLCEKCYTDTWGELPEPDDWNYPEELKETKPKKKKKIKLIKFICHICEEDEKVVDGFICRLCSKLTCKGCVIAGKLKKDTCYDCDTQ